MSKRQSPPHPSLDTLAIRTAQLRTEEMAHSEALFLTSSFVYDSAEQAAARFAGDEPGNIYLMRDIPNTQQYCDIDAATTVGAGTAVSFKMTWFDDPRVSLLQSGTDPNLIMGSPNFYNIGTLR